MTDMYDALSAPFAADEIDWRIGSTNGDKTKGMALAYIDARAVMDRLDTQSVGAGNSLICNLGIRSIETDWGTGGWRRSY
jgi:hypothetical protein